MAPNLRSFLLLFCTFFFSPATSLNKSSAAASTPNSFPNRRFHFEKEAVEAALNQALKAQSRYKWLSQNSVDHKERAACADCLVLYQHTIDHLNRMVDPTDSFTAFDMQTWLSTALTNLDTCRVGFKEVGVDEQISDDVTQLISNILASFDAAALTPQTYDKNSFPSWLSKDDRILLETPLPAPDVVVAKDGSGNFGSIQAALDAAADRRSRGERFVIHVKKGVYEEILRITGSKLKNIMMVGDGLGNTIVTGNLSAGRNYSTYQSATVAVTSDGFIARGITFRNTAGPHNHQAVALRSGSDHSIFYLCGFEGYQDTLYTHSQRQFYRDCSIYGTIDFIFGNAAAVLQNCRIYARRPLMGQKNVVTAQGRTHLNQTTGISILNSRVMAAPDLVPVQGLVRTYLGRPWKEFSRTVVMDTYLDDLVDSAGWTDWNGTAFALDTLYYGEYRNTGPASSMSGRVSWKGYRGVLNEAEASRFTVANFIAGSSWLADSGVPFANGL